MKLYELILKIIKSVKYFKKLKVVSEEDLMTEKRLKSLAPNYDLDEDLSVYKEFLDNALLEPEFIGSNKKKNKNIAVTGNYGAGKSSFIYSCYKNDDRIIYISLGNYIEQQCSVNNEMIKTEQTEYIDNKQNKFIDCTTSKIKNNDDNIEISILQQILYSVRPYKIPYSRFKRIDKFFSKYRTIKRKTRIIFKFINITTMFNNRLNNII